MKKGNQPIKPKHVPVQRVQKNVGEAVDDFKNFTIAVSIEWDGKPPRMTWYDRLHRKGIRVRGGDASEFKSPLARRQSLDSNHQNNGVVFQEGLILCRNQDLANELAYEAEQFGAINVMVGRIFMDRFSAGAQDVEVLENYFLKTSKRGRKPIEQAGKYTITCLEELLSYEAELDAQPVVCPTCQAFRFYAHVGNQKVFQQPKWNEIDNMFDYWLRSRFDINGLFDIPQYVSRSKENMALIPPETPSYAIPEFNLYLPDNIKWTPELRLRAWDACYALSSKSETDRLSGRLGVLGAYWNAGGQDTSYTMAEPEDGYDLIDVCILLRKEFSRYL